MRSRLWRMLRIAAGSGVALVVLLVVLLTVSPSSPPDGPATGASERIFIVVDEEGGPLPGVNITVESEGMNGHLQPTDARGERNYDRELMLKSANPHQVRVRKEGYRERTVPWPTAWPATIALVRQATRRDIETAVVPKPWAGVDIEEVIYVVQAPFSSAELRFHHSGSVRYTPSVDRGGVTTESDLAPQTARITADQWDALADLVKRCAYWTWPAKADLVREHQEETGMMIMDASTYILTIRNNHPKPKHRAYKVSCYSEDELFEEMKIVIEELEKLWGKPILEVGI